MLKKLIKVQGNINKEKWIRVQCTLDGPVDKVQCTITKQKMNKSKKYYKQIKMNKSTMYYKHK